MEWMLIQSSLHSRQLHLSALRMPTAIGNVARVCVVRFLQIALFSMVATSSAHRMLKFGWLRRTARSRCGTILTRAELSEMHTLSMTITSATLWDGNGYRILMGSMGIKATLGDANALIAPARTFDTVTNAPIGGVNYSLQQVPD